MKYWVPLALVLTCWLLPEQSHAACSTTAVDTDQVERTSAFYVQYENDCANNNEIVIETGNVIGMDTCWLMSKTGAVDVDVTFDFGSSKTWSTAPLALYNFGAASLDKVLVTTALQVYAFPAKFAAIRVRQNGAVAADAILTCYSD